MVFFICCMVFFFVLLVSCWFYWVFFFDSYYYREKGSAYECGFDPSGGSRVSFSLRFFSFLMLFVIFDVELVLLLKLPYIYDAFIMSFFVFVFFLFFLFFSVCEEWRRGYLDWY